MALGWGYVAAMRDTPPILFLHGAFVGPPVWERFVAPWFAARGHRVAVPHLADTAGTGARLRDYVRAARLAAEELGGAPIVVGHSLGGIVAQHLATEGRVSGAVLVASPGPWGLGPSLWHLSSRSRRALGGVMLAQIGAGANLGVDEARDMLFTPHTPDAWIRDVMEIPEPESALALFDAMTWDLPLWPLAREVPMLAVQGDRDAFVPLSDLWSIGLAYGSETEVFRGVGHGLPIDPAWKSLAWRINAWIDERGILARRNRRLALSA